jgi:hypothetical protein
MFDFITKILGVGNAYVRNYGFIPFNMDKIGSDGIFRLI